MFALVNHCIAIGSALAALTSPLYAGVVVVQSGSLQAAIDAAADGDVLLVSGGPYIQGTLSTISGKSLSIIADPPGSVTIGPLLITGITASKQCTITGLVVRVQSAPLQGAVTVTNCSGSVRLEALRLEFDSGLATPALTVADSTDVAVVRSELYGSDAAAGSACCGGHPGGTGMFCSHSKVALYDCHLLGGPGEPSFTVIGGNQTPAGAGGPGMRIQPGSTVLMSNCVVEGGPGATGLVTCPTAPCTVFTTVPPGAGGNAFQFEGSPTEIWLVDSVLIGGPGGSAASPLSPCCTQPSAAAGSSAPGTAIVLPAAHLVLSAPPHVREQTSLALQIDGTPGDLVGLFAAEGSAWQLDLPTASVILQGPTMRRLVFGTIPPSGTLALSIPVGALPQGLEAQLLRLQVVSRAPSGAVRIGSPAVLTILDQAF